jgi:hypothetical protein
VLAGAGTLWAQPFAGGGFDPSAMSGIPLPDGGLPSGTVTVRVIRGTLTNPVRGATVTLGGGSAPRTAPTDDSGRARFDGVAAGGSLRASVTVDGVEVASQPFQLGPQGGVRLMLVAPAGQPSGGDSAPVPGPAAAASPAAAADGAKQPPATATDGASGGGQPLAPGAPPNPVATPDAKIPHRTVVVTVRKADGSAVAAAAVQLVKALGNGKVQQQEQLTGATGEATFTKVEPDDNVGYLAVVRFDGAVYNSQPFHMGSAGQKGGKDAATGLRLAFVVHPRTVDVGAITLGPGSHLILQVAEEAVEVIEVFSLRNGSGATFDPGPEGLLLPLPEGFKGASIMPGGPPQLDVREGKGLVWRGAIPPGDVEIRSGSVLSYDGDSLELHQQLPLGMAQGGLIVDLVPGMSVQGPPGTEREEKEMNGRRFLVLRGVNIPRGGQLDVSITGLPQQKGIRWRYLFGLLAAALATWALLASCKAPPTPHRQRVIALTAERERLFAQLLALDARPCAPGERSPQREQLVRALEQCYRELDELGQLT